MTAALAGFRSPALGATEVDCPLRRFGHRQPGSTHWDRAARWVSIHWHWWQALARSDRAHLPRLAGQKDRHWAPAGYPSAEPARWPRVFHRLRFPRSSLSHRSAAPSPPALFLLLPGWPPPAWDPPTWDRPLSRPVRRRALSSPHSSSAHTCWPRAGFLPLAGSAPPPP